MKILIYIMGKEYTTLFLRGYFPQNFPRLQIVPTTEPEIKSITNSLRTKNSSVLTK
jgi:hypothetical protein